MMPLTSVAARMRSVRDTRSSGHSGGRRLAHA
jgi:hypothetical protein